MSSYHNFYVSSQNDFFQKPFPFFSVLKKEKRRNRRVFRFVFCFTSFFSVFGFQVSLFAKNPSSASSAALAAASRARSAALLASPIAADTKNAGGGGGCPSRRRVSSSRPRATAAALEASRRHARTRAAKREESSSFSVSSFSPAAAAAAAAALFSSVSFRSLLSALRQPHSRTRARPEKSIPAEAPTFRWTRPSNSSAVVVDLLSVFFSFVFFPVSFIFFESFFF